MSTPRRISFDPVRISYVFFASTLVLLGWLHLGIPLVAVLFSVFALRQLSFGMHRMLGLILFLLLLAGVGWGSVELTKRAYHILPRIAQESIPMVLDYAERKGVELPFTDYASLRSLLLDEVKERMAGWTPYARGVVGQLAAFVIGVVVAISLFLNTKPELAAAGGSDATLYGATFREVVNRFRTFYHSFANVMGAQILISAINTVFTAGFLLWNHFPYASVLIGLTFALGLLPIVGNLVSNTLIMCVGFTLSPRMAVVALLFLVVIHKCEYFLNSKIIGRRIQNPMWLTLLGLVIGEKLMGIPGMILAPVLLHYVKIEASRSVLVGRDDLPGKSGEPVTAASDPADTPRAGT